MLQVVPGIADVIHVLADAGSIITGIIAVGAWLYFRGKRSAKKRTLYKYLKHIHHKDKEIGKQGLRLSYNIMRYTRIAESELIDIAFEDRRIKVRNRVENGRAVGLMYGLAS